MKNIFFIMVLYFVCNTSFGQQPSSKFYYQFDFQMTGQPRNQASFDINRSHNVWNRRSKDLTVVNYGWGSQTEALFACGNTRRNKANFRVLLDKQTGIIYLQFRSIHDRFWTYAINGDRVKITRTVNGLINFSVLLMDNQTIKVQGWNSRYNPIATFQPHEYVFAGLGAFFDGLANSVRSLPKWQMNRNSLFFTSGLGRVKVTRYFLNKQTKRWQISREYPILLGKGRGAIGHTYPRSNPSPLQFSSFIGSSTVAAGDTTELSLEEGTETYTDSASLTYSDPLFFKTIPFSTSGLNDNEDVYFNNYSTIIPNGIYKIQNRTYGNFLSVDTSLTNGTTVKSGLPSRRFFQTFRVANVYTDFNGIEPSRYVLLPVNPSDTINNVSKAITGKIDPYVSNQYTISTNLTFYPDTDSIAEDPLKVQSFQINSANNGSYFIQTPATIKRYMALNGGGTVVTQPNNPGSGSQWSFIPVSADVVENGTYYMRNRKTGMYLRDTATIGKPLSGAAFSEDDKQQFYVWNHTLSSCHIRSLNADTTRALGVNGSGFASTVAFNTDLNNQSFTLTPLDSGYYKLWSDSANKELAMRLNTTTNKFEVIESSFSATDQANQWQLIKIDQDIYGTPTFDDTASIIYYEVAKLACATKMPDAGVKVAANSNAVVLRNANNYIYRFIDSTNTWQLLSSAGNGTALDVAVQNNGKIWYLGTGNNRIYKRNDANTGWITATATGTGKKIAIGGSYVNAETIAIIGMNNALYTLDTTSGTWNMIPNTNAKEIAVDHEGNPWYIANDGKVYMVDINDSLVYMNISGKKIACGDDRSVVIIGTDNNIWGYNIETSSWQIVYNTGGVYTEIALANATKAICVKSNGEIWRLDEVCPNTVVNKTGTSETLTNTDILYDNSFNKSVIFPNPTNGKFTVALKPNEEEAIVVVLNSQGQRVANNIASGVLRVVDISNQPSGIYYVQVTNKTGAARIMKLLKK